MALKTSLVIKQLRLFHMNVLVALSVHSGVTETAVNGYLRSSMQQVKLNVFF